MKLRNIIILLSVICAFFVPARMSAAETADQILAKCAQKVNSSPSISIKFVLSFDNNKLPCDLLISKDKYHLSSNGMQVWYDGKTQWTYINDTKQLSITEPTTDELLESNPFAILNHYKKAYSCKRLSGKGLEIQLTAKSKASSIQKAVVSIDPRTYLPSKVVVTISNGKIMTAAAGTTTIGKLLPAKTFIYNKAKFPAKETIDLR